MRASASLRRSHLVLGHLSEENNRPELAARAARYALDLAGLRDTRVHVAQQDVPLGALGVYGRARPALMVLHGGEQAAAERQLALF